MASVMQDVDIAFSRVLLRGVHDEVRKHLPKISVRKDAYVMNVGRDHWEFHGPDNYYNGSISASNAYEARANGWLAYLKTKGITE